MPVVPRTAQRLGPKPWAYAAGIVISWVVFATAMGAVFALDGGDLGSFAGSLRLLLLVSLMPAAVVGSAGVLVLCGFGLLVGSQGWHVAIAAATGWAVGVLVFGPVHALTVALAIAAACGRVALVPHVVARRREVETNG